MIAIDTLQMNSEVKLARIAGLMIRGGLLTRKKGGSRCDSTAALYRNRSDGLILSLSFAWVNKSDGSKQSDSWIGTQKKILSGVIKNMPSGSGNGPQRPIHVLFVAKIVVRPTDQNEVVCNRAGESTGGWISEGRSRWPDSLHRHDTSPAD